MITVKDVHKHFGTQAIFEGACLQINAGDRYALVGPNGAGKSTLMKMLLGAETPDSGEILFKSGVSVGYLPQENPPLSAATVLEEALCGRDDPDGKAAARAKSALMGLGFRATDFGRRLDSLSGGWAMRAAMARLLMEEPDLLLLDEPTNHLDLEALLWFQETLQAYRGAIFLISHDRGFINRVARAIVSLEGRRLKPYYGDYEYYLSERAAQRERLEAAAAAQKREIADLEDFIHRNRARASTAARAQSAIKRLEKIERIELPPEARNMRILFPQPERTGVRVLSLQGVCKSYGETRVYSGLDLELERGWKTAFVGPNGAGKSTLLKILAGVVAVDGGERELGLNVKAGYFSQHRAGALDPERTVFAEASAGHRHIPDETVRTVLGAFLFPGQAAFKKVGVLSGGEKSRLSLVKLLLDPPNLLLMDEPTTHLDLASVDALLDALRDYEGTLCFISHDVYFINALADHVAHIEGGRVRLYPGNYEYFERRQTQVRAEAAPAPSAPPTAAQPRAKPLSPKELRRLRAQERERARRAAGSAPAPAADAEKIEARIAELTRQLEDPSVYGDFARVRAISDELRALQKRGHDTH